MRVFVLVLAVFLTFGCQKKDDSIQSSQTEKPSASQTPPAVTEQTGKFVINPQFDSANNFSEGLAAVRIDDDKTGKWGYIDKQGKMAINPQFDSAFDFREGLAAVLIGDHKTGKRGFIDKQGKMVINPQFNSASNFSEGLAAVRIGDDKTGKWGYISR